MIDDMNLNRVYLLSSLSTVLLATIKMVIPTINPKLIKSPAKYPISRVVPRWLTSSDSPRFECWNIATFTSSTKYLLK